MKPIACEVYDIWPIVLLLDQSLAPTEALSKCHTSTMDVSVNEAALKAL